jgi:hypothetical protein
VTFSKCANFGEKETFEKIPYAMQEKKEKKEKKKKRMNNRIFKS